MPAYSVNEDANPSAHIKGTNHTLPAGSPQVVSTVYDEDEGYQLRYAGPGTRSPRFRAPLYRRRVQGSKQDNLIEVASGSRVPWNGITSIAGVPF